MSIPEQDPRPATHVEIASQAVIDANVRHHLRELGMTLSELEAQAAAGEFTSERARRLWFFWVAPGEDQP